MRIRLLLGLAVDRGFRLAAIPPICIHDSSPSGRARGGRGASRAC